MEKFKSGFLAAPAGNATVLLTLVTEDEDVTRTITGLYVTAQPVNTLVNLVLRSQPVLSIGGSVFNTTHGLIKCHVDFPQGQQIQVQLVNGNAGVGNAADVIVRYEVPG